MRQDSFQRTSFEVGDASGCEPWEKGSWNLDAKEVLR